MLITLKDNSTLEMPEGSTIKDLIDKLNLTAPDQGLGATVNGKNSDLSAMLREGDKVAIWNFDDPRGKEVFWHTSAHVLAQAILRLWPNAQPTIGPPIENGFYYDFGNLTISDQDFEKIEREVDAILAENFKTERTEFASKEEAK